MTHTIRAATRWASVLVTCALALSACDDNTTTDESDITVDDTVDGRWEAVEWSQIEAMSTDGRVVPSTPSNRVADDAAAAKLGQMLFFETSHAGPIKAEGADDGSNGGLGDECDMGRVSCESCHQAGPLMMTDERSNPPNHATTIGTGPVGRNVPGAADSVYYDFIGLSGARDSLWSVSAFATLAAPLGSSELTTVHMIMGKYKTEYNAVFEPDLPQDASAFPAWGSPGDGAAFDGMTAQQQETASTIFANYAKALGAYQRLLITGPSAMDRYAGGDFDALTDGQKDGLELFLGKAQCATCHTGPSFTDNDFHNIATSAAEGDTGRFSAVAALNTFRYRTGGDFSDQPTDAKLKTYPGGTFEDGMLVAKEEYKGQFRTASLRGIADSPPYMHKGNLNSLLDVVKHYNEPPQPVIGSADTAFVPLGLTDAEMANLVLFLESLSGEPVASGLLNDTSRSHADAVTAGMNGYQPSTDNLPEGHACRDGS